MDTDGTNHGGLNRRHVVAGGLALAGLQAAPGARAAAAFPIRPVSIVAPTNPGGGWDIFARAVQFVAQQAKLSPVAIEVLNRGGAGGTIGLAELVARHRGDPYTIMASGSVMVSSSVAHNSPMKLGDTDPLCKLASDYLVVAVPVSSPFMTIQDLIDGWKADPGAFSWCGGSAGGIDHMLVGILSGKVGVPPDQLRYVAYAGAGEASASLLGGQTRAGANGYSEWKRLRDDGRVRFLAVSSRERIDDTTPTLVESGLDVVLENWRGLVAPPGLSAEERAWWMDFLRRVHASAEWQEIAARYGWVDAYLEGEPFKQFIAEEERQAAVVLASLGISTGGSGYAAVGPWTFPTVIGIAGIAAVIGIGVEHFRKPAPVPSEPVLETPEEHALTAAAAAPASPGDEAPSWKRLGGGLALIAAYLLAMPFVGFLIATPLFLFGVCILIGSKALIRDGLISLAVTGCAYLLFSRVMHISLP